MDDSPTVGHAVRSLVHLLAMFDVESIVSRYVRLIPLTNITMNLSRRRSPAQQLATVWLFDEAAAGRPTIDFCPAGVGLRRCKPEILRNAGSDRHKLDALSAGHYGFGVDTAGPREAVDVDASAFRSWWPANPDIFGG